MIERTLVLIKPDGVQRGLVGKVITRFENAGLKIVGVKMKWVDSTFSKKHYAEHVDKAFYKGLEKNITEGPVVAMVVEGLHVVEVVRKMVGGTEPRTSPPGTIRGDFAHHSYENADKKGIGVKNIIHASANLKDAKQEITLWFSESELYNYKTVYEVHTM